MTDAHDDKKVLSEEEFDSYLNKVWNEDDDACTAIQIHDTNLRAENERLRIKLKNTETSLMVFAKREVEQLKYRDVVMLVTRHLKECAELGGTLTPTESDMLAALDALDTTEKERR